VGPYSLADPTTLCAITEARGRGEHGSSRIALPAPDPDAPHQHQASLVFESKLHRLHGTVHSNGFGHLMRLNGREGGSRGATGRQLMQVGRALEGSSLSSYPCNSWPPQTCTR
jgi:hypothetical protein